MASIPVRVYRNRRIQIVCRIDEEIPYYAMLKEIADVVDEIIAYDSVTRLVVFKAKERDVNTKAKHIQVIDNVLLDKITPYYTYNITREDAGEYV